MASTFPLWQRLFMRVIAIFFEPFLNHNYPARQGFNVSYAEEFKKELTIPVFSCGGFNNKASMENAVRENRIDAISIGRGLIANPYLFHHLYHPIPQAPVCDYCNLCIGSAGGELGVGCFNPKVQPDRDRMLKARIFHSS